MHNVTALPYLERRKLLDAWQEFLESRQWSYFLTLSNEFNAPASRLHREFKRFVKRIERILKKTICWMYAIERGQGGHLHIHALIWLPVDLPPVIIAEHWRMGNAHIDRYHTDEGAARYTVKDFGKSDDEYFLSDEFPPMRTERSHPLVAGAA